MNPIIASRYMNPIIASILILSTVALTFAPLQDAEACWGELLDCLAEAWDTYEECKKKGLGNVKCWLKVLKTIRACYKAYKACKNSSSS